MDCEGRKFLGELVSSKQHIYFTTKITKSTKEIHINNYFIIKLYLPVYAGETF